MLGKAKSLIEYLQSSWNASGSNADDFQMSLYAAIEDEYNSGNVNKGLLAKVNVETGYDDKHSKAKYIKARVDLILKDKDVLLKNFKRLQEIEGRLFSLNRDKDNLSNSKLSLSDASHEDYKKAKDLVSRENDEEPFSKEQSLAKIFLFSSVLVGFAATQVQGFLTKLLVVCAIFSFLMSLYYTIKHRKIRIKPTSSRVALQSEIDNELIKILDDKSSFQQKKHHEIELEIRKLETEKSSLFANIANTLS